MSQGRELAYYLLINNLIEFVFRKRISFLTVYTRQHQLVPISQGSIAEFA